MKQTKCHILRVKLIFAYQKYNGMQRYTYTKNVHCRKIYNLFVLPLEIGREPYRAFLARCAASAN